jgi:hypothetical protein
MTLGSVGNTIIRLSISNVNICRHIHHFDDVQEIIQKHHFFISSKKNQNEENPFDFIDYLIISNDSKYLLIRL